jgi:glycerophosphoryl diester phosphodiesterase
LTEIQGHRGARGLSPENTLPGLATALAVGVDAIEFDVTLTADGGLILAHDLIADVPPYAGVRWADLTLAQVATLDVGSPRPPAQFEATFRPRPGTGVPTLSQVCQLITEAKARQVTLAVELKTDPSWPANAVRALAQAALATLAAHGPIRARILAFDWRVLTAAQAADPAVPRVALIEPTTWEPGSPWLAGHAPRPGDGPAVAAAAARDIGAAWLSPWDGMATADLIAAAHETGLRVVPWTVNDAGRMTELIQLGADAIVTDDPRALRQVLTDRGEPLPAACELPWDTGVPEWAPRVRAR